MSRHPLPTTTPDLERLKAAIRSSYAVPVDSLELVSTTGTADSYVGRTDRWQFGLTAWPDPSAAEPPVQTLALEHWLGGQGLSFNVPEPLLTVDGDVVSACDEVPFAVFELVYGRSMAPFPEWTPEGRDDQARVLAAVHALRPPDDLMPPLDDVGCAPVFCNNAFHGDNLVVKRHRVAGVLAWEHAVMGPPELDLQIAVLGDVRRFLDVYAEAGGTSDLHIEHFELALRRRLVDGPDAREMLDEQLDQLRSVL